MSVIKLALKPFNYQLDYWLRMKGNRFGALGGGRRSGKSVYGLYWLLRTTLEDTSKTGVNIWCSPTMKQAMKVGLLGMQALLVNFPAKLINIKLTDQTLSICGREILFTSSDNAEAMRGLKIKRIVMDEAAFQREYIFTDVIRPALADLRGSALLCSTFNGFNWYYDMHHNPSFISDIWPTANNPTIHPDELQEMKNQMDVNTYKQEILAQPTTLKGLVYENTFGEENIIADYEIKPNDKIGIGLDFGYTDPCAVSFFAYNLDEQGYPVVYKWAEIYESKLHIETIMQKIIDILATRNINPKNVKIAVDIAGLQTTGVSVASYIGRMEAKRIFNIVYKKCEILNGVNLIRAWFLSASGIRRFFIARKCTNSLRSYSAYEIKKGEQPFSDSKNDHIPDADRYFFENIIRPLIPSKKTPTADLTPNGRAERTNCLRCGTKFITFTNESHCITCNNLLTMEI